MVTEAPVRTPTAPVRGSDPRSDLDRLRGMIRGLMSTMASQAIEAGMSPQMFAEISSEEMRPFIEAGARAGYAAPAEGLAALLDAEGSCVDVAKACEYYRRPKAVSRQAINEAIKRGELLAYRTGSDQYMLPTWQFRPEGGVIEGFPEALQKLRETVPHGDQLTPFAFFLQADPVTDGRTPLAALRAGDRQQVFDAIEARLG
jgi:hypothetical protein